MSFLLRIPRRLLIAASVALLFSACGGGDPAKPPAYNIQQTAELAVRDGLVGAVFEYLTATGPDFARPAEPIP